MIINIISIIAGGVIGWFLPALDKIAYIYILHPEAQISQYLRFQLERNQFQAFWKTLKSRQGEFDKLTTRGILFQLTWIVLAIFTMTSVPELFGQVLVISLGVRILVEEWREWLGNKEIFAQRLLWQVNKTWSPGEIKWYLISKTLLVGWLCLLLVR